jgi:murein DD-endopeptidase MepM/ murein hydrolase activator NlpD
MTNFSYIADGPKGRITSPFGNRFHPVKKIWKKHAGLDIGTISGTDILAMADGVVVDSKMTNNACGGTIAIDHGIVDGKKLKTRFCHCSKLEKKVGDQVKKGEVIAKSGGGPTDEGRGTSTGPHIHFEVYENGRTVDPKPYYDGSTVGLTPDSEPSTTTTQSDEPTKPIEPITSQSSDQEIENFIKYMISGKEMTNQEKNKALLPLLSSIGLGRVGDILSLSSAFQSESVQYLKNLTEEIKRMKKLL